MSQTFSAIPTRANATTPKIDAGWFNILRLAGVQLETAIGISVVPETTFTFANGQPTTDVTAFLFSSATWRGIDVEYNYRRSTASAEAVGIGKVRCFYRVLTSSWDIGVPQEDGDASGITWTISAAGQLKYSTDTLSGASYVGASRIRAMGWSLAV